MQIVFYASTRLQRVAKSASLRAICDVKKETSSLKAPAAVSAAIPACLFSSAPPALKATKVSEDQSTTVCSHVHITSGYHATGARRYPFSLPRVYPPWVLPAPYPPASEFAIFPGGGGRRRHVPASLSSLPPSPPPGGGGGTG